CEASARTPQALATLASTPAQLPARPTTTSAGDGPGRWRGGPSAAAPARVRGGGVGGRRPGFGDTDVAEKPPWQGSRRPGRGPPTPPPPRQPPATAEGPARHRHRDSHPQRRHNTATPKTPAHQPRESRDSATASQRTTRRRTTATRKWAQSASQMSG